MLSANTLAALAPTAATRQLPACPAGRQVYLTLKKKPVYLENEADPINSRRIRCTATPAQLASATQLTTNKGGKAAGIAAGPIALFGNGLMIKDNRPIAIYYNQGSSNPDGSFYVANKDGNRVSIDRYKVQKYLEKAGYTLSQIQQAHPWFKPKDKPVAKKATIGGCPSDRVKYYIIDAQSRPLTVNGAVIHAYLTKKGNPKFCDSTKVYRSSKGKAAPAQAPFGVVSPTSALVLGGGGLAPLSRPLVPATSQLPLGFNISQGMATRPPPIVPTTSALNITGLGLPQLNRPLQGSALPSGLPVLPPPQSSFALSGTQTRVSPTRSVLPPARTSPTVRPVSPPGRLSPPRQQQPPASTAGLLGLAL